MAKAAHQVDHHHHFATKTVDIIMPQQHMYMEHRAGENPMHRGPNTSDVHPYDPKNPCATEPGTTCKNLGTETVNGRSADHWQITHKDGKVSDVWIDNPLHFPIKTVSEGTIWQLTNIKEGSTGREPVPGTGRLSQDGYHGHGRRWVRRDARRSNSFLLDGANLVLGRPRPKSSSFCPRHLSYSIKSTI